MDKELREKYGITFQEEIFCAFVRFVRGCTGIPKFIYKMSKKRYGRKDCLARFWWAKYSGVPIGKYSYGYEYFTGGSLKSMGNFCSVAVNQIIAAANHEYTKITTSPIAEIREFGFLNNDVKAPDKGVVIGNDVWIGAGCIIFDGVTIGDGAVIGAGSIIRKDVPPYAVVVGVDRIVKYRFDSETVAKLLKIKWWHWEDERIKDNMELMKDSIMFVDRRIL